MGARRRRITTFVCIALIASLSPCAAAFAESPNKAEIALGKKVFYTRCVFCHGEGPGHPAWQMLELKKGKSQAEIVGRADLTPVYIKHVVRNGLIEMPPFRPSEISQKQLNALAAYITNPKGAADPK
ncbi:MAG: c-type cytochrome [Candidatus Binataceae bacterium]